MKTEKIILAGGCFWGVQELIRKLPGVGKSEVGYVGGLTKNPRYPEVKTGKTGHAEAVYVEFDPEKISLDNLFRFFFRMHDPTTPDRQGNDIGSQYRSAIFYYNSEQKQTAKKIIKEIDELNKWNRPIVTQVVPASEYFSAEDYHQDYLIKNPEGYNCHFIRD